MAMGKIPSFQYFWSNYKQLTPKICHIRALKSYLHLRNLPTKAH